MKLIQHSKPTFYKDIASGRIVRSFEKRFSRYIGCADAIATNSGTSALHLSLLALGIGRGDEVIMPSYVCASLLDAVNYVGARPIVVDVDYDTFNISAKEAKRRLTKKTKALILPHMFGLPCDIKEFLRLGIPIIEDCAQSLGAWYKNKLTGSFGAIAIFSFYATKLITTGYGGMIGSNSKRLLEKIRDLSNPNKRENYKVRYNYKISDLQAALGIDQLKHLGGFIKKRKEIAREYTRALSGYDIELPFGKRDRDHIFYRYVVKTKKANFIKKRMIRYGIEIIPPVYKPLHRYLLMGRRRFPNTERLYREVISLPIYPSLKREEFLKVVRVLGEAI